jgi:hypothetical protein
MKATQNLVPDSVPCTVRVTEQARAIEIHPASIFFESEAAIILSLPFMRRLCFDAG